MKWLSVLFLASCAVPACALPGQLTLNDGSIIAGEISLEPNAGFIVAGPALDSTNIPLGNVRALRRTASAPSDASPFASLVQSNLPPGWTNRDIGSPSIEGSAKVENGVFSLKSAGARIWQAVPDQFHFAFRTFTGNGQMIAQITGTDAAAAGIMFRQSVEPGSEFVLEGANQAEGLILRSRRNPAHRELVRSQGDSLNREETKPPCWLKLTRRDKNITAFESTDDGLTWQRIYELPTEWGPTIHAGLFVVSSTATALQQASFANVLLEDESDFANATNRSFTVQILLNDGTILNAESLSADQSRMKIGFGGKSYVVSVYSVARLIYQPVPERFNREIAAGRKGVLLKTGDFFEGQLHAVDKTQVTVSSVLFGPRTFPVDRVMAVSISESAPAATPWLLRTADGSTIRAKTLSAGSNSLVLDEPRLGRLTIPLSLLSELQTSR